MSPTNRAAPWDETDSSPSAAPGDENPRWPGAPEQVVNEAGEVVNEAGEVVDSVEDCGTCGAASTLCYRCSECGADLVGQEGGSA